MLAWGPAGPVRCPLGVTPQIQATFLVSDAPLGCTPLRGGFPGLCQEGLRRCPLCWRAGVGSVSPRLRAPVQGQPQEQDRSVQSRKEERPCWQRGGDCCLARTQPHLDKGEPRSRARQRCDTTSAGSPRREAPAALLEKVLLGGRCGSALEQPEQPEQPEQDAAERGSGGARGVHRRRSCGARAVALRTTYR